MRDALGSNTILDHLDNLDLIVEAVGLGPCGHAAIFETVATANNGLKVGNFLALLPCLFLLGMELTERISHKDTGVWTESIVVQVQVLQRYVG